MATPTATDIERLLKPVAPDAPTGVPLRYEGTYDKIRDARREDDPSLPLGVWERPLKTADPAAVAALCEGALERSKDLQIAAWLTDAWASLYGFTGVARGLELLTGICERFWGATFPLLDDEGDEQRAGIFEWTDAALARRARAVKLGDERGPFTLADWERAGSAGGEPPPDEPAAPSREALLTRISLVGSARWVALRGEVAAALAATAAFAAELATHMDAPPSLRRLNDVLRAIQVLGDDVLRTFGGQPALSPQGRPADVDPAGPSPRSDAYEGSAVGAAGPIASRADAYRRLTEAADYLLRTEPHSPVPYLIKRAISWGNMSLAELLQEFVTSADDLVTTHRLLGMRRRDE
jgi:type VI secretion system protein ImpA